MKRVTSEQVCNAHTIKWPSRFLMSFLLLFCTDIARSQPSPSIEDFTDIKDKSFVEKGKRNDLDHIVPTTAQQESLIQQAPFIPKEKIKCDGKDLTKIVADVLRENPSLVLNALQGNERAVLDIVENALREEEKETNRQEQIAELRNPLRPDLNEERPSRGPIEAPVTIVEYSDFQCPFCRQSYRTLKHVLNMYPHQVRIFYKHLTLPNHTMARITAQFFEAIALESHAEAWIFHDEVFEDQERLALEGQKFLWSIVEDLAVDRNQIDKNLKSPKVLERLEQDEREASDFGFTGTPIFLINGISLRGASTEMAFEEIIEMALKEKTRLIGLSTKE